MMKRYWHRMWKILEEHPELERSITAFLLNPERVLVYFGRTHVGIEYVGPVHKKQLAGTATVEMQPFDYTDKENLLDAILGFQFNSTHGIQLPLTGLVQDLYVPTNAAFDVLSENGWSFSAQPMMMGLNSGGFFLEPGEFTRLINCFFYGTDHHGLLVRQFQWIDFMPLTVIDVDEDVEAFKIRFWPEIEAQVRGDILFEYPLPQEFQEEKLIRLNRFIELFSSSGTSEPDITRFLAEQENQFILKMAFFGKEIYEEKICLWADESRSAVRPDFFVTQPNGYADIVEFKLPMLKGSAIVGRENREAFSAELQQYIAQTRVYRDYFADPRNRSYVEQTHGIRVHHPRRWLVTGRRWMFSSDEWRSIEAEYDRFGIRTYDDLVDGVRAQLYS